MCGINRSKKIIILSFADTFTSLLAGTIIFSILGHLAYTLDQPVDQVLGIFIITHITTITIIINVTTTTTITINIKTTTTTIIITEILPRWSNPVQVLLLSATRKFSLSLISPRRYFVLKHLIRIIKSKFDIVLIESWPSNFHVHKKKNKRWLQQRILYWQDKARHENVWHENFHKRGKSFVKKILSQWVYVSVPYI